MSEIDEQEIQTAAREEAPEAPQTEERPEEVKAEATSPKKRRFDYRHILCGIITLGVVLIGIFRFPYSLERIIESFRDLWQSAKYYFCELFLGGNEVTPTVNDLPKTPILSFIPLPDTWNGFKEKWTAYWRLWVAKSNVQGYLGGLTNGLYGVSMAIVVCFPFLLVGYYLLGRCLKTQNNDYDKDSKPLKAYKSAIQHTYVPVRRWATEFIGFIRARKYYCVTWLCLWLFYFNAFTIAIEFIAYYLYFVVSFDFLNLYRQVYKLFIDLSAAFTFIPLWAWVVVGLIVLDKFRKNIAYGVLNHFERRNRGFINARPIVYMVCGTMGKKKTTAITDMALSQEAMLRDKAFEKILENDLKFPNFPWINLENAIKREMNRHTVYNLATARKYVRHLAACFYAARKSTSVYKSVKRHLRKRYNLRYDNLCFGYDYERYGFTYDDKLKITDIWETIETYAQLYFIYIVQSSLIISNYSVRTDDIYCSLGNFPMWNSDFFTRDSKTIDCYSRHAHILDFDSLRLGKKVIEENKNADGFEFGVIVITEIGKERGNNLELSEKKKKDETANQKNDLFNSWLKMVRHSATVDNYPFVRVITDEQRPESWGADARDLCEIVSIKESSETYLAMPFFSLAELLYGWLFGKFANLYYRYRYVRSDNTLPMFLLKSITAKIQHYYTGIYNRFGYCALRVQIESGTQDGERTENKYYLMNKKIYSKRFSTDCFSDFFTEKALRSAVGIDDLREYATEKATFDELTAQNSYFVGDLLNGLKHEKE